MVSVRRNVRNWRACFAWGGLVLGTIRLAYLLKRRGHEAQEGAKDQDSVPSKSRKSLDEVAAETAVRQTDLQRQISREARHKAREWYFWRRQLRTARCLNYITAIGAGGAVLGLVFVGTGLVLSRQQLDEMRAGNIASQRAWLKIESIDVDRDPGLGLIFNNDGAVLPITINIRNVGNSPAIKISWHASIVFEKARFFSILPDKGDECSMVRTHEFGIGPTIFPADPYNVQQYGAGTSWDKIPADFTAADLIGCIDYTFATDSNTHHQTPFYYALIFKNPFSIPTRESVAQSNYVAAHSTEIRLIKVDLNYGAD